MPKSILAGLLLSSLIRCLFVNKAIPTGVTSVILISFFSFLVFTGNNVLSSYFSNHLVLACPGPDVSSNSNKDNDITRSNISNNGTSFNNSLTFENSTLGIKMQYPADWIYHVFDNDVTFTPMAAGEPMFEHSMTITVGTNYSTYTIGQYEDLDEHLLDNGTKFTITPVVIAGLPAIKNEFTAFRIQQIPCPPPFPAPVSITNIYIPFGDKVYTIEYRSETDLPGISATILQMIQSLEIRP